LADGLAFASVASLSALKGCTRERAIATCPFLIATTTTTAAATRTTQVAATSATTVVVTVDDLSAGGVADAIALTARLFFVLGSFALWDLDFDERLVLGDDVHSQGPSHKFCGSHFTV
jgi:hypothetical protein